MGNKHIYIAKRCGRCDSEDFEFFASAELLHERYLDLAGDAHHGANLTRKEFLESIENEELIEEFNSEFYRDVVVT